MRWLISRLSVSSCVSPGPLTPIPPRNFSRWAHMRVRRGSMYCSCASSTCIFASLDRARVAKISSISSARSITRWPVASSMFLPWDGDSSSSNTISDAFLSSMTIRSSSTFPFPRYVAGLGLSICCVTSPTTRPPAVSTSLSSSSRCSLIWCFAFDPLRGAPTRIARSTGAFSSINSLEILLPRVLRPTKCGEATGTAVRYREIASRCSHCHVTADRVRNGAAIHHLPRRRANSGVGEVDRDANGRRIVVLNCEARIEHARAQCILVHRHRVGEARRIELVPVRIVDVEIRVERTSSEAESSHAQILEVHDRLLESAESEGRASSDCEHRQCRHRQFRPARTEPRSLAHFSCSFRSPGDAVAELTLFGPLPLLSPC